MATRAQQSALNIATTPIRTAGSKCNVALVGFGTVGSSVARLLCERELPGLQLTHVCNRDVARKRVDWVPQDVCWTENFEAVVRSPEVDVVVELVGGLDPAGEWIRRALLAGKSVVTANKKLIAKNGPQLLRLAREKGVHLLFGAAVAGGVPVLAGLEHGLGGDRQFRVRGIVNGTCNYMLSSMEARGLTFNSALTEAQERGYAEADPTDDVEGYDARSKLAILSWVGLRAEIDPEQIACRSITGVDAVDFSYARDLGCTIRQISWAEMKGEHVLAGVQPALVPLASPLSQLAGSKNMVIASGQYGGDTVFAGNGAGGPATAVAVVSDLLLLAKGQAMYPISSRPHAVISDLVAPHYVRFIVNDRPGIVAAIATVFSQHAINVDAVLQKPGFPKSELKFAVTVELCSAKLLASAMHEIDKFDFLVDRPLCLPILDDHADLSAV